MSSLRWIDISDMPALTAPWLAERRELFVSIPELAPLLPRIETVHRKVVEVCQAADGAAAREQVTLTIQEADRRHDVCIRALWNGLTAAASWVRIGEKDGPGRGADIRLLRDRLLPEGLRWVLRPYEVQIQNARSAAKSIQAGDRAVLREIVLFGVTALEIFETWCETAEQLEELMSTRELIGWDGVSSEEAFEARCEWADAVKMVMDMLKFAKAPTPKVDLLLGSVQSTLAKVEANRHGENQPQEVKAALAG